MEKKKNGLIILVIILSILVLVLSGYIVYDKVLKTDIYKDNDNVDSTEKNEDIPATEVYKKVTGNTMVSNNGRNGSCVNGCIHENVVDGVTYEIYVDQRTLKINDRVIFTLENISYLSQVSLYDDIIITLQTTGTCGNIVIYNYEGIIVKEFSQFRDEQNRLFYTYVMYDKTKDFNLTNDGKIQFVGSKHLQGGANSYLDDENKQLNLCSDGKDIPDDAIVEGIFEFSYLGNNNFSDIKYVSTISTVKEMKYC